MDNIYYSLRTLDTNKNENFQPQDDKIIFQKPIQIAYNFLLTCLQLSYEILATFLGLAYDFHTIFLPFSMTFLQSFYNFLITPLKLACDLTKGPSINDVIQIFQLFNPSPSPCHLSYALKITPNCHFLPPSLPPWGYVIYG